VRVPLSAGETREVFNLDRPMTVIPNFVDTRRFSPARKPRCGSTGARGERILVHLSISGRQARAGRRAVFATVRAALRRGCS